MEMTSPQWRSHQSWAKGLRTLGGFLRQCGGRLDKTGAAPKLAWRRGWGQTRGGRGVYEPAFQPLFTWEGPRQKAEVSNRTRDWDRSPDIVWAAVSNRCGRRSIELNRSRKEVVAPN